MQSHPTWSPDGRFIAYSSDRGGKFDIWVQQVGGGEPVRVTTSRAHDWQPDWSPDGKLIVFRSEREEGGLYVVPALGGHERKISSFGYRPRWSPDGSQILFNTKFLRETAEPARGWVVALEGGAPREILTEVRTEIPDIRSVAWHADSRRVSFFGSDRNNQPGFWTVPLAGGRPVKSELGAEVERRFQAASISAAGEFVWAPSGAAIYFEGTSKGVSSLWKITVEPNTLRLIAGPERLTTGAGQDVEIALSRDGKELAFSTRSEKTRIWSIPFDAGRGKVKGQGGPVSPAGMDAWLPDISRDGKKIVYVAQHAGREELWEKSLDSGRETLLESDNLSRVAPRWSPDSTRVGYTRANPNTGEISVAVLPADGGNEELLTPPTKVQGLPEQTVDDWSSDGKWILGSCTPHSPQVEICLLPVSSAPHAETRVVTSNRQFNLWEPRFSPNGRWISFNAVPTAGASVSTLYVVPSSGGEWTRISEGNYWDDQGRWAPDGKTLYFISSRTGFLNVWGIRFDPLHGKSLGAPFQVTAFESPSQMVLGRMFWLKIALSQNLLVLPITEVSGNLWMLEDVDK